MLDHAASALMSFMSRLDDESDSNASSPSAGVSTEPSGNETSREVLVLGSQFSGLPKRHTVNYLKEKRTEK